MRTRLLLLPVAVLGLVGLSECVGSDLAWTRIIPTTDDHVPNTFGACMIVQATNLLVLGGVGGPDGQTYQATFSKFGFDTNTWSELNSLPMPLSQFSCVEYQNTIFTFGGESSPYNTTNKVLQFDNTTANGNWSIVNTGQLSPAARMGHAASVVGSTMFVFGGLVGQSTTNEMWSFDLEKHEWKRVESNPVPSARYGHNLVSSSTADTLVLFGGFDSSVVKNDVWTFSTNKLTWTQSIIQGNVSRAFACGVQMKGELVLFGGLLGAEGTQNDMWMLDLGTGVWVEISLDTAPSARMLASCGVASDGIHLYMFGGNPSFTQNLPANETASTELWSFTLSNKCSIYSTCDDCVTQISDCGWCAGSNTCVDDPSSCSRGYSQSCPLCGEKHSCGTCASTGGLQYCGWCEDTRTCSAGDSAGPFVGHCNHYYFGLSSCPTCSGLSNCGDCMGAGNCGWCFANNTCSVGDQTGSYYSAGCTNADSWWYAKVCPDCHAHDSECDSCTTDSNCGYCLSTGQCLEGNEASSYLVDSCTRGYRYSSPCPDCTKDPSQGNSCKRCTNHTSYGFTCGWCDQRGSSIEGAFCAAGDTMGPFGLDCPSVDWFTKTSSCTSCSQKFVCATCVVDLDCVWCQQHGGYCIPANTTSLCDASKIVDAYDTCSAEPPNWDPNGWNSNNNYGVVAVVMGVISVLAVLGLVGAVLWWKRQSKQRLMPDAVSLAVERQVQPAEHQREDYMYRNSLNSALLE